MKSIVETEHPHVVKSQEIREGSPVVKGTRIRVSLIAQLYKQGETPDDIMSTYPHLTPASVYDAISYFHDHQAEIEEELTATSLERVLGDNDLKLDDQGRVTKRTH